jgi:hypothetical protein
MKKNFPPKLRVYAVWAFMLQNIRQPCAAWMKFKERQFSWVSNY